MTLGEKLRSARLEAGLSQRQLCGDQITRNMLSQIENGSAQPSMDTLRYLAGQLGKPLSYFLDEEALASPNQAAMEEARRAFDAGDFTAALEALETYREPDGIFDRERQLLQLLSLLGAAEQAADSGRELYALELLARAGVLGQSCPYYSPELEKRRLLLFGRARKRKASEVCELLPSADEELLLRAQGALELGDIPRAAALLDAAQTQASPRWQFLRGEAYRIAGDFQNAAACFRQAEAAYPAETAPLLEQCYRDLGDFEKAYFYACKQR